MWKVQPARAWIELLTDPLSQALFSLIHVCRQNVFEDGTTGLVVPGNGAHRVNEVFLIHLEARVTGSMSSYRQKIGVVQPTQVRCIELFWWNMIVIDRMIRKSLPAEVTEFRFRLLGHWLLTLFWL